MTDNQGSGSQDDDSWLPVPVFGRRGKPFGEVEFGTIEPVMYPRAARTGRLFRGLGRKRKIVPGLVADLDGIHAGGLFIAWDSVADIVAPELWHQHPQKGFQRGAGPVVTEGSPTAGLAMALVAKPPAATVLLFERDFADDLTSMWQRLTHLLANPHERPTVRTDAAPATFPYLRGMNG